MSECGFVHTGGLRPAWVFSVGSFVAEELEERKWSRDELAIRMGGDFAVNRLTLDMMIEVDERTDMMLGDETAAQLERAFGVSAQFWLNVDAAWRASSPDQRDHTIKEAPR